MPQVSKACNVVDSDVCSSMACIKLLQRKNHISYFSTCMHSCKCSACFWQKQALHVCKDFVLSEALSVQKANVQKGSVHKDLCAKGLVHTSTVSLKALAWSKAACPILPSITKMTKSGCTLLETCRISSNSASSCLCRPLVSTMIRSWQDLFRCNFRRRECWLWSHSA